MTANPALRSLTVSAVAAAVVAVGLYIFGTQHTPDYSTSLFGETGADTFDLKSWLATGVLAFAAVQVGLALWMHGRLPWVGVAPPQIGPVHRAVGAGTILLTIPIAYHFVLAYGVQTGVDTRVAVHSIAGCFIYGAFLAKIVLVQTPRWRLPGWALPVVRSSSPWRCSGTRAPSGTSTTSSCPDRALWPATSGVRGRTRRLAA